MQRLPLNSEKDTKTALGIIRVLLKGFSVKIYTTESNGLEAEGTYESKTKAHFINSPNVYYIMIFNYFKISDNIYLFFLCIYSLQLYNK